MDLIEIKKVDLEIGGNVLNGMEWILIEQQNSSASTFSWLHFTLIFRWYFILSLSLLLSYMFHSLSCILFYLFLT